VLYVALEGVFYVSTLRTSVKARNVRENPRVAVCIPVRRFPFIPPFHVSFQGRAELHERDEARIVALLDEGRLRAITSHGELDDPDSCFLTITPGPRVATYGLGVPLRELMRDPIHASRSVKLGS
jgi:general stress protein 26